MTIQAGLGRCCGSEERIARRGVIGAAVILAGASRGAAGGVGFVGRDRANTARIFPLSVRGCGSMEAHIWYSIATARAVAIWQYGLEKRDQIARKMTPEQLGNV